MSIVRFLRGILYWIMHFRPMPDGPRVSYESRGRDGYVVYSSPEGSFSLYYEFGGGDVVATIIAPKPQEWRAETGFPLEQRDAILHFIGRETAAQQTRGGSYTIEDYGVVIWG